MVSTAPTEISGLEVKQEEIVLRKASPEAGPHPNVVTGPMAVKIDLNHFNIVLQRLIFQWQWYFGCQMLFQGDDKNLADRRANFNTTVGWLGCCAKLLQMPALAENQNPIGDDAASIQLWTSALESWNDLNITEGRKCSVQAYSDFVLMQKNQVDIYGNAINMTPEPNISLASMQMNIDTLRQTELNRSTLLDFLNAVASAADKIQQKFKPFLQFINDAPKLSLTLARS
jgi:hypothetical protein